jgi:hypothetical protein
MTRKNLNPHRQTYPIYITTSCIVVVAHFISSYNAGSCTVRPVLQLVDVVSWSLDTKIRRLMSRLQLASFAVFFPRLFKALLILLLHVSLHSTSVGTMSSFVICSQSAMRARAGLSARIISAQAHKLLSQLLIGTRAQTLLRVKFNFGTQRRTYACVRA